MKGAAVLLRVKRVIHHKVRPDWLLRRQYEAILIELHFVQAGLMSKLKNLRNLSLSLGL